MMITMTPDVPRSVQAMVRDMAVDLRARDIYRFVPWMNQANLYAWLRGDDIRLSERAIDQIMHAITLAHAARTEAACPAAN
jgi:hypothetical protein